MTLVPLEDPREAARLLQRTDEHSDQAGNDWDALVAIRKTAALIQPTFESALESRSLEVVLSLWHRLTDPLATPFQIYLECPEAYGHLGLHPRPLIAPLTRTDEDVLRLALFDAKRAREIRRPIRLALAGTRNPSQKRTDWEDAIVERPTRIPNKSPALSFQCLEVVGKNGIARRLSRPVIGRYASRKMLRDSVLAVARGPLNSAMHKTIAPADCSFLSVQGIRGRTTLGLVRSLIEAVSDRAGVLVAATPSELFELAEGGWPTFRKVHVIGAMPVSTEVHVVLLAPQRQQLDRLFAAATEGLESYSPTTARLLELGKSAWWAAVRSVSTDERLEPAVSGFLAATERAAQTQPDDAERFRALVEVVLSVMHDETRAAERRNAAIAAAEAGAETILVPTKATQHALELEPALQNLGLRFLTATEAWRTTPVRHLAVLGVTGSPSLDAMLALRPEHLTIIVDPVEARVAVALLSKWAAYLRGAGAPQSILDLIVNALQPVAAPTGTESPVISLDFGSFTTGGGGVGIQGALAPEGDLVRVRFVDGTDIVCSRTSRFDVVADGSNRLESRPAGDLEAGDEILMVASHDARVFSEHLIDALDAGKLADAAAQRKALLRLIRRAAEEHSLGGRAIARSLFKSKAIRVSPEAVGAWLRGAVGDATVANTRRNLEAVLEVLRVELPADTLDTYWSAVRAVRAGHRLAGRQVVHAIRAAAAGRLGAQTMFRIERDYGWNIRQLIQAAQALVVDEVEDFSK